MTYGETSQTYINIVLKGDQCNLRGFILIKQITEVKSQDDIKLEG